VSSAKGSGRRSPDGWKYETANRGRRAESEPDVESEIMTLREVADYLNCHYVTVYRLIKPGLPAFRLGSDWRFQRSDLKKWIAQQHDMAENRPPGPELKAAKARPKSKA